MGKLTDEEYKQKSWNLGMQSALMIVSGYYGELVVKGTLLELWPRWLCWIISMYFFKNIVEELLYGLAAATESESDVEIADKIRVAQKMTVISWCTYPVVYLFPMVGMGASSVCCFDSGWLLLFRHHFQVRCGTSDLPDLQCEIKKGGLVSMKTVALRPFGIIFGSGICSVSILAYPFRNFSSRLGIRFEAGSSCSVSILALPF